VYALTHSLSQVRDWAAWATASGWIKSLKYAKSFVTGDQVVTGKNNHVNQFKTLPDECELVRFRWWTFLQN